MLVSCPRCAGPESEQSRRARFSAIAMNMKIVSVGARSDGTRAPKYRLALKGRDPEAGRPICAKGERDAPMPRRA